MIFVFDVVEAARTGDREPDEVMILSCGSGLGSTSRSYNTTTLPRMSGTSADLAAVSTGGPGL
jgi:hypothetical protein